MKIIKIIRRILKARVLQLRVQLFSGDPVSLHFNNWTDPNHVNRIGFEQAISALDSPNPKIFETGTSAYGIDSTRLFDLLALRLKGELVSVDLSAKPKNSLRFQLSQRSKLFVGDSVSFIQNELNKYFSNIDLCYLDSWDVDWRNPKPSESHGFAEFHHLSPFLKSGALILIDDTPVSLEYIPLNFHQDAENYKKACGYLPGKGALILKEITSQSPKQFEVLHHEYNLLIKKL